MDMNLLKAYLTKKIEDWIYNAKHEYGVDATLNEIRILPNSNCQNILVDYVETVRGITTRKVDIISVWPDFDYERVYDIWMSQEGIRLNESQYKEYGIKSEEKKMNNIKILSKAVLSEKLKASLIKLASKYYPEGDIIVHGPTTTGVLIANYYPTPQEYATLSIQVVGDDIVDLGNFDEDTDPKLIAFKNAFNEAKKRVAAKQPAPTKPVQAPVKPVQRAPIKLPVLNRSEFNNLDLPKSAIVYVTGAASNKNKVHITVNYAITHETSTHYIVLTAGTGGFKHRLQGKSAEELVSKLGDFIGIPGLNARLVRQGGYEIANTQQIAEYLATAAAVKL